MVTSTSRHDKWSGKVTVEFSRANRAIGIVRPLAERLWKLCRKSRVIQQQLMYQEAGPQPGRQLGQPGNFKIFKNVLKAQKLFWLLGKTTSCNHFASPPFLPPKPCQKERRSAKPRYVHQHQQHWTATFSIIAPSIRPLARF